MSNHEPTEKGSARWTADRDPNVEGVVTDRTGVEKPVTFSGTANPLDRFCELCTYASSARFTIPEYRDGIAVCPTHARGLVNGYWDHGVTYEAVPIDLEVA